ncbi:MAG: DUF3768 domain-containing protein [Hyphomicrobiaceae bacterium]
MREDRTARMRELNDGLRRTGAGGFIVVTSGVDALAPDDKQAVFALVRSFDAFTPDNDPWREHDFGSVEHDGQRYFWKITYYQAGSDYSQGAEDPSDASTTARVMTIMMAEEY